MKSILFHEQDAVSYQQETDATICTDSPKVYNSRFEKSCLVG